MGIDVNRLVHPSRPDLMCASCGNVLEAPVQSPCDHRFCSKCVDQLGAKHSNSISCPLCSSEFFHNQVVPCAPIVQGIINNLLIHCENFHRGCTNPLRVSSLAEHVCGAAAVHCPFQGCAYTYGTSLKLNRNDLDHHKTVCEARPITCPYQCGAVFPASDRSLHEAVCLYRVVVCSYCNSTIPYCNMDEHLIHLCPKVVIHCEVDGCEYAAERGMRDEWLDHMSHANVRHTEYLATQLKKKDDNVVALTEVIKRQNAEVQQLKAKQRKELEKLREDFVRLRADMEKVLESKEKQLLEQAELLATCYKSEVDHVSCSGGLSLGDDDLSHVDSPSYQCVFSSPTLPRKRRREIDWTHLMLDSSRHGAAAAWGTGSSVYIVGGFSEAHALKTAVLMDARTGKIIPLPSMQTPRAWCGAAYGVDRLFVVGGCDGNGTCLNTAEMYSPASNQWCALPAMRTAREGCAVVLVGCRLLVFGGFNGTEAVDSVEMLDLGTMVWITLPRMPSPRVSCCAAVIDGEERVVVMGGSTGLNAVTSVDIFDLSIMHWMSVGTLSNPRIGAACAFDARRRRVIIAGGSSGSQNLMSVEAFSVDNYKWTELPSLHSARMGCAGAFSRDMIAVVGGSGPSGVMLNNIEVFDLSEL